MKLKPALMVLGMSLAGWQVAPALAQQADTASPAEEAAAEPQFDRAFARDYNIARDAFGDGDCDRAKPAIERVLEHPNFEQLTRQEQLGFKNAMFTCANEVGDIETSWAYALELAEESENRAYYLGFIAAASGLVDPLVGLSAVLELKDLEPERLSNYTPFYYFRLQNALKDHDNADENRLALVEALKEAEYASPDPIHRWDWLHEIHGEVLLAQGERERAFAILAEITHPMTVLRIQIDRRFETLWGMPDFENQFDLMQAATRELDYARTLVAEEPKSLAALSVLLDALHRLGRNEDAARAAADALALLEIDDDAFDDREAEESEIRNQYAYILRDMGDADAGREMLRSASETLVNGNPNYWAVSNLADYLMYEGRFFDALLQLAKMPEFGLTHQRLIVATGIRACAHVGLNNKGPYEEAMEYIKEYREERLKILTEAFLCANEADAVAQTYLDRLAHEEQYYEALLAFQDFQEFRMTSDFMDAMFQRVDEAVAREDVRAAALKRGRFIDVPFQTIYWGRAL